MTDPLRVRLARFLMATAAWIVPAQQRDWLEAMGAEFTCLSSSTEQLRWSGGCLLAAACFGVRSPAAKFHAISFGLLVLLTIHDWRSADPTVTFVSLVLIPGILAYADPRRRWAIGLLFGTWLLLAHGVADLLVALRPHYQRLPLSAAELVEIALLLAITLPAAAIGAHTRRAAAN